MKQPVILCAALAALVAGASMAQAQTEETQSPEISAKALLNLGFEVKAMALVQGAFVLTLQRGTSAYVCETDSVGASKICVEIK